MPQYTSTVNQYLSEADLSNYSNFINYLYKIITSDMINKIVGYGGFKSYGEEHYPTRKQGKQLQLKNEIWSSTKRDVDKADPLNNYNHYHTIYKNSHLENTQPKDYHPEHVVRGSHSTLNFNLTSATKAYDQIQAQKLGQGSYKNGFNLLKTGTEHWKTTYQGNVCQPALNNKTFSQIKSQSTGKPHNNGQTIGASQNNGQTTGKPQSNATRNPNLLDEELSKALSYKNRPYINDAKTGITDYRFNYGQKIGSTPLQLLNQTSSKQPVRDHPLKHGTNQLWTQIPCYQGFKPAELHFEQLKTKMQKRENVERGSKKLNLIENYHVNVPGYAGYKPKYDIKTDQLRDSCFQYKKK